MENRLARFADATVILPMRYCAGVGYYALLASHGKAIIDCTCRYNKRDKAVHRMDICDTHGLLRLTVPVSIAPETTVRPLRWSDIDVSAHGHWWNVHITALESAYGRTPYFQFYIDRFADAFRNKYDSDSPIKLWELNSFMNDRICDILSIPRPTYITHHFDIETALSSLKSPEIKDCRNVDFSVAVPAANFPYYQVRRERFGFMAGLSILDLIFNMGPESPLILHEIIKSLKEL